MATIILCILWVNDVVMIDVAIIGSGPAALSAALYLARAELETVVFERGEIGGELSRIAKISNYPGFDGAGKELAAKFRAQAEQAGAKVHYGECLDIVPIEASNPQVQSDQPSAELVGDVGSNGFDLQIDNEKVRARAVLVATGSEPRPLDFEITPPVSYCALCEGDLARGKNIAVIGGANSAVQESLYLAPIVKHLTLISHSPLKADQYLQKLLRTHGNIEIMENVEPDAKLLNNYDYVFVFIGTRPATNFLRNLKEQKVIGKSTRIAKVFKLELELSETLNLTDSEGYIITGSPKSHEQHETVYAGLFAAGDVRYGVVKQVAAAVGDGVSAATEIIHYLRTLGKTVNQPHEDQSAGEK